MKCGPNVHRASSPHLLNRQRLYSYLFTQTQTQSPLINVDKVANDNARKWPKTRCATVAFVISHIYTMYRYVCEFRHSSMGGNAALEILLKFHQSKIEKSKNPTTTTNKQTTRTTKLNKLLYAVIFSGLSLLLFTCCCLFIVIWLLLLLLLLSFCVAAF